jgi:hypothetical protein
MLQVLLKVAGLLGAPTLLGILLGKYFDSLTPIIVGFCFGLVILFWIASVKIKHLANSIQRLYRKEPDNHS